MLKKFLASIIIIQFICSFHSNCQDIIYKKDSTIQKAKILEIGTNTVKYKKYEIIEGPTFELLLKDIVKIRYYNGYEEKIETKSDSDSLKNSSISTNKANYSMIYMVYNHGHNESNYFPCYFNDHYILNINGNDRLKYKIFSEGKLVIERRSKSNGPRLELNIKHGEAYYIYIEIPNQYATNVNKKFALRLITDDIEINKYKDYFGFRLSAFKSDTKYIIEDSTVSVIKN